MDGGRIGKPWMKSPGVTEEQSYFTTNQNKKSMGEKPDELSGCGLRDELEEEGVADGKL